MSQTPEKKNNDEAIIAAPNLETWFPRFYEHFELTSVKSTWAMGAQPMGAPGWPDMDFCTMSAASTRTVLIAWKHNRTAQQQKKNGSTLYIHYICKYIYISYGNKQFRTSKGRKRENMSLSKIKNSIPDLLVDKGVKSAELAPRHKIGGENRERKRRSSLI